MEWIGDDVGGIAVHMAARLLVLGSRDDVIVSSTTRDLLEGSGLAFADAGTHELKGVTGHGRCIGSSIQASDVWRPMNPPRFLDMSVKPTLTDDGAWTDAIVMSILETDPAREALSPRVPE